MISSYAPSLLNFRKELIQMFITNGYKVVLLAPDFDSKSIKLINELGATTKDIKLKRSGTNLIQEIKSFISIYYAIKSESPDIVFSYTIKPVIYGSIAAYFAKVPKICSLITGLGHSFLSNSLKGKMLNILARLLYSLSLSRNYAVLFQNKDDCKLFVDLKIISKNVKTTVINGSGVNIDYYYDAPLPDHPIFLLIARLIKEKGIREYALASGRLKIKYPNTQFNLVGWFDNHPASLTKEEIDDMSQNSGINFLGAIKDVRKNIIDASVYVLPSYREGTPRSVLEAMSMGRPIITTDVAGCRETVIDAYNGFLVNPYDSVSLEIAMEKLILDPNLRSIMGKRSRVIATEKYEVDKVNNSIFKIIG